MQPLIQQIVKTQAGEGKMYSAASFKRNERVVEGIPVDRFSFTLNLENPLFQQPGQKAGIEALLPDGKMEFEYAVKDDRLLAATPDRMKELIEGGANKQSPSKIAADNSTFAAAYINLLAVIKGTAGANPEMPEAIKERMAKLDAKGTAIRLDVEMDSSMRCKEHVPLKLIEQLGHLKGAPKQKPR